MHPAYSRLLLGLCLCCSVVHAADPLRLEGLPLQLEWLDLNGDQRLDLVALLIRTQVEGTFDTSYEAGGIRGFYQEETSKEKFLATYLQNDDGFRAGPVLELGRETVFGFALEQREPARLALWRQNKLQLFDWHEDQWHAGAEQATPGFLGEQLIAGSDFQFWHKTPQGTFWLVPDINGLHILKPDQAFSTSFLAYPLISQDSVIRGGDQHQIKISLPRFADVDRDAVPEMLFENEEGAAAFTLAADDRTWTHYGKGLLADFNNDGLLDKLEVLEETDVDGLKDLKKVKSHVQILPGTGPLEFGDKPLADQWMAGWVIPQDDNGIFMPEPFLDLNRDGRLDLAGIAMRLNFWQVAKVATIGRIRIKFLLHLSQQKEDGSFQELNGSPFEFSWRLNIRKLRLPDFAQVTGDIDGNRWTDLMVQKDDHIAITPINETGIALDQTWKVKLPRAMREPDQVFARDLNNDQRDEIVVVKLGRNHTLLNTWEYGR